MPGVTMQMTDRFRFALWLVSLALMFVYIVVALVFLIRLRVLQSVWLIE